MHGGKNWGWDHGIEAGRVLTVTVKVLPLGVAVHPNVWAQAHWLASPMEPSELELRLEGGNGCGTNRGRGGMWLGVKQLQDRPACAGLGQARRAEMRPRTASSNGRCACETYHRFLTSSPSTSASLSPVCSQRRWANLASSTWKRSLTRTASPRLGRDGVVCNDRPLRKLT